MQDSIVITDITEGSNKVNETISKPNETKFKLLTFSKNTLDFNSLKIIESNDSTGTDNQDRSLTKFKIGLIPLKQSNSSRIINSHNEVKYQLKRFICIDNQLYLYNKTDYSSDKSVNIIKLKDSDFLYKCLINQKDEDNYIILYTVQKDNNEFAIAQKNLGISKEEIIKADNILYFEFTIHSVNRGQFNLPSTPDLIEDFITNSNNEVRYNLYKGFYQRALNFANPAILIVTAPKKELKKLISDDLNSKLINLIKPTLMNKTLALIKKENPNGKGDEYDKAVKTIQIYESFYNKKDDDYLKMMLRKLNCLIALKAFKECAMLIDSLENDSYLFSKDNLELIPCIKNEFIKMKNKSDNNSKHKFNSIFKRNITNCSDDLEWSYVTTKFDDEFNLESSNMFCRVPIR